MKKYTQPELSVSKFDVEDIITTSATFSTGYAAVTDAYGDLYTTPDYQAGTEVTATDKSVVYFNWN